jgi:aryl-alcohol dehydrogenase-like predicted oxidoreductase
VKSAMLGGLWPISRLTLGGGGIGQVWGRTTRAEAEATVRAAVDAGINLLDLAPSYGRGEAERVVGSTFNGKLPQGVRVTTKFQLGNPTPEEVRPRILASLERSLERLKLERVDLLFLHSNLIPDDYRYPMEGQDRFATPWELFTVHVRPVMEELVSQGRIDAWGMTGVGLPETVIRAIGDTPRPAVVQAVANLLDSPGAMRRFSEEPRPRAIIDAAVRHDVGVLGIRAVQAGALTSGFDRELPADHPDMHDFRISSPFRELATKLGVEPALLAHRYALSMAGVDSVVLGVKNREELRQCVEAEALGPLEDELLARIDALGLREESAFQL